MRIATWNINGLRSRLDFVLHWLRARQPDIVGLQELKLQDDQFPTLRFEAEGYHVVTHGQKAWNGVAILSREPAELSQRGLSGQEAMGSRLIAARIAGIGDRGQAEKLTGTELWVARAALPETANEEEYYHHDLIGLAAYREDGAALGQVVAMRNYGAGDLLELRTPKGPVVLVPFTRRCVPVVDVQGGRVVIDPLPGLLDEEQPAAGSGADNPDGEECSQDGGEESG